MTLARSLNPCARFSTAEVTRAPHLGRRVTLSVRQYIAERVSVEDRGHHTPCWIWQRSLKDKGYGRGKPPGFGRTVAIHRVAYEEYVGPIGEGREIDHLCRVRRCCNPWHLEAVTHLENVRRSFQATGRFRAPRVPKEAKPRVRVTHCKRGHEFTAENTITRKTDGSRTCRICYSAARKAWRLLRPKPVRAPLATRCRNGHEYTPENTIIQRGWRRCCTCKRETDRQHHLRRKARAAARSAPVRTAILTADR